MKVNDIEINKNRVEIKVGGTWMKGMNLYVYWIFK